VRQMGNMGKQEHVLAKMTDKRVMWESPDYFSGGTITIEDSILKINLKRPIWNCYTDDWLNFEKNCPNKKEPSDLSYYKRRYANTDVPCYESDDASPNSCNPLKCPHKKELNRIMKNEEEIKKDILAELSAKYKEKEQECIKNIQGLEYFTDTGDASRLMSCSLTTSLSIEPPYVKSPRLFYHDPANHDFLERKLQEYEQTRKDCKTVLDLIGAGKYKLEVEIGA